MSAGTATKPKPKKKVSKPKAKIKTAGQIAKEFEAEADRLEKQATDCQQKAMEHRQFVAILKG